MFAAQDGATPNDKLYVDDVFSAYTYTGNGSTQTITNGIDLAGKGGMVWIKHRTSAGTHHQLFDTFRSAPNALQTDTTYSQGAETTGLTSFNSTGFVVASGTEFNANTNAYVSWTFRKAAKFFDVVTYTGNGVNGRNVSHSLGMAPGMVILKRTDNNGDWFVWHRSGTQTNSYAAKLNLTDTYSNYGWNIWGAGGGTPSMTLSTFSVGDDLNVTSCTYVAYLFAHDTSADGLVQCGSFTTDGSGNATVNHGWSAGVQFALIKCSSTTGDWEMFDTARTSGWSGSDARLRANLGNAEDSVTRLSASGTSVSFAGLSNSATYIYMLIVSPT